MEPDLCVVMDAPVQVLKERAQHRAGGERFDNLDEQFLDRVRAGYLWEAKQRGYPVVFADDTPEHITGAIWKYVADVFGRRTGTASDELQQPVSVKEIIQKRETQLSHHRMVCPTSSYSHIY
jgi:hypothetical protein